MVVVLGYILLCGIIILEEFNVRGSPVKLSRLRLKNDKDEEDELPIDESFSDNFLLDN